MSIFWRSLHKGSKNPPPNKQILLRAKDGSWGVGRAIHGSKRVLFDYEAMEPTRAWFSAEKHDFTHWADVTI